MERVLELLLGRFTGIDELAGGPWSKAETVPVEIDSSAELGGALLVMRMTETRSGGTFSAVNVVMSDRDTGEILLYGFDDFGYQPDPPARGGFHDHELILERSTVRGQSRLLFAGTPLGFSWTKLFRAASDEPWLPVVTGDVQRVASA